MLNQIAAMGPLFPVHTPLDRGVIDYLTDIANEMMTGTYHITRTDEIIAKAAQRVFSYTPPAKQGKESFKDCILFEECLEFARQVRARKSTIPIALVTSNSSDFCISKLDKTFKTELQQEGNFVGLSLLPSWTAVKGQFGL